MKGTKSGVTVVDLMVSVAILAIVFTAIYSVFAFQQKAVTAASEGQELYGQGLVVTDRLVRDLKSAWLPIKASTQATRSGVVKYQFNAAEKKIDFFTSSSLSPNPAAGPEIVEVGYRLEEDPEGKTDKLRLIRRQQDTPNDDPEEGGYEIILTEDLVEMQMVYETKDQRQLETLTASTADELPTSVTIRLVLSTIEGQEETFFTRVDLPMAWPVVTRIDMGFSFGSDEKP